jgi:hypothetical protein
VTLLAGPSGSTLDRVQKRAWAVAAGLVLVPGCGSRPDGGPGADVEGVRVQYGIHYTVGADQYDDRAAKRDLGRCTSLPGASFEGQDDSLPPGPNVRFSGGSREQAALEKCLHDLPDSTVNGPFPVPSNVK